MNRPVRPEDALRESEARAQAVLDAAVDGIITIDTWGIVQSFNRAAERLFGYAAQEVIGKNITTLMPQPYRGEHDGYLANYLRTGVKKIIGIGREVVAQRKDGSVFPVELAVSEVALGDNQIFTGIVRDLTARKRAERRLAVQYAVTRFLASATSLAVAGPTLLQEICDGVGWDFGELWRVDFSTNVLRLEAVWHRPSLNATHFVASSRGMAFSRGSGLPGRVWAGGQPVWNEDVDAARSLVRSGAAQIGLHGSFAFPVRSETTVLGVMVFFARERRPPEGDWLETLDALGRQIGDFIESRRAQDAWSESERRFADFMHHLPGVAFMKDDDGRYVFVSDAFEQLFHRKPSEYIGKTDEEVWPAQVAAQLSENDAQVRCTGELLQTIETIPHDDGPHYWLATKFPILDNDGRPGMVGGISIDITARKRAEDALRDLEKRSQQRERLADVGAITAQLVHDLGNPLAGISMQAQLILHRAKRASQQSIAAVTQPVERILSEVQRLDSLIKEFMDFSREQRLDLKEVDVAQFLREVVDLWRPVAAARQIAVTVEVPRKIPSLTADQEKLRRVFDNLLKNAIEAIDEGPGYVGIHVTLRAADAVCISVSDTGPGIPDTVQVFRLFETTKAYGSGIGLAVARQIVQAHRGTIEFARREPRGTVFHVELPQSGLLRRAD